MMTLEKAIKAEEAETLAYEECLNSLDDNMPTDMWNDLNKSLGRQMDYHRQLAEWLRELITLRGMLTCNGCVNEGELMNNGVPCSICKRNKNNRTKFRDYYRNYKEEVNADD